MPPGANPQHLMRERQTACKPGSVPASRAGDGHSSGTPVTGRLVRPTRAAARELASPATCRQAAPTWSCSRWGLPCRRRYRRRGALLPHPFTLTGRRAGKPARPGRRFAFCGTVPGVAPAGRYPAPCSRGARTFLCRQAGAGRQRPSGRLAHHRVDPGGAVSSLRLPYWLMTIVKLGGWRRAPVADQVGAFLPALRASGISLSTTLDHLEPPLRAQKGVPVELLGELDDC